MKCYYILHLIVLLNIIELYLSTSNFAICINGNIQRLELGSKIENLFIPNLLKGYNLYVFGLLEPYYVHVHHQNSDYKNALYINYTSHKLNKFIHHYTTRNINITNHFITHVRFREPVQQKFSIINHTIPFSSGYRGRNASEQYQLSFRQFNALRQCAMWIQEYEITHHFIFNYIIRIREDAYVMKPWIFQPVQWKDQIVISDYARFNGVCDRWFVIDRKYINKFIRGLVENYYFNYSIVTTSWSNTEDILYRSLFNQNLPNTMLTICDMPLITIRQIRNNTHWYVDILSVEEFLHESINETWYLGGNKCLGEYNWNYIFESLSAPINPIDMMILNYLNITYFEPIW